ncbi:MAG: rhodanese-like domain-containing protein [Lautropia sp.]|nr:rhodanese-like domain-containing protein [Lautropia sp.]
MTNKSLIPLNARRWPFCVSVLAAVWISVLPAAQAAPEAAGGGAEGGSPSGVARQPQAASPVWIDVRTPAEYQAGHLPGAQNLPLDEIAQRIAQQVPLHSTPIRLYCKSGRRAEKAREILRKAGYTQVENRGAYEDLRRQQQN